jgi:hypothetical protein
MTLGYVHETIKTWCIWDFTVHNKYQTQTKERWLPKMSCLNCFPRLKKKTKMTEKKKAKTEVGKGVGNDKYYEGVNPILLRWVINPDVL